MIAMKAVVNIWLRVFLVRNDPYPLQKNTLQRCCHQHAPIAGQSDLELYSRLQARWAEKSFEAGAQISSRKAGALFALIIATLESHAPIPSFRWTFVRIPTWRFKTRSE